MRETNCWYHVVFGNPQRIFSKETTPGVTLQIVLHHETTVSEPFSWLGSVDARKKSCPLGDGSWKKNKTEETGFKNFLVVVQ
jgi:hypothetical protein